MSFYETIGLLFTLISILSIIMATIEIYKLQKRQSWKNRVTQLKEEGINRSYILVIENIALDNAYSKCIDWLSTYKCQIIESNKPRFIKATHRFDIPYFSFWLLNPKLHKDIPKQLEFNLRRFLMTDTEITLNVSIKPEKNYITEYDFMNFEWYKEELHDIFKDFKIHTY
jgi:hypothetical protein